MRLIEVLDVNPLPFMEQVNFKLDFSKGSYNVILVKYCSCRNILLKEILRFSLGNLKMNTYVMSGFNLKPYLNLTDNIYDVFGIDLELDVLKKFEFQKYCDIFKFNSTDYEFHFLSEHDKFKSMFITALFSESNVILFDGVCYKIKINGYMEDIYKTLNDFELFSDKSFIELRKASHCLE